MKAVALALMAGMSSACGARIIEVKTQHGGFCLICMDKPDSTMMTHITKGDK